VDKFEVFEDGATVDLTAILAKGLVSSHSPLLKVLGGGDLSRKLTVRAQKFSASAVKKIQDAGGQIVTLDARGGETTGA
jgi:large subunit ribosomal protein L15